MLSPPLRPAEKSRLRNEDGARLRNEEGARRRRAEERHAPRRAPLPQEDKRSRNEHSDRAHGDGRNDGCEAGARIRWRRGPALRALHDRLRIAIELTREATRSPQPKDLPRPEAPRTTRTAHGRPWERREP